MNALCYQNDQIILQILNMYGKNKLKIPNYKILDKDIYLSKHSSEIKDLIKQYKKKRNNDIPYLPVISKQRKPLFYDLNHIWLSAPNGILFKKEIKKLKKTGMFKELNL